MSTSTYIHTYITCVDKCMERGTQRWGTWQYLYASLVSASLVNSSYEYQACIIGAMMCVCSVRICKDTSTAAVGGIRRQLGL